MFLTFIPFGHEPVDRGRRTETAPSFEEAKMNPAMKFAAHERGSARTLVMGPGTHRAAAEVTPIASVQRPAANVGSYPAREHHVPADPPPVSHANGHTPTARTVSCRAGQKLFGPGGGGGAIYLLRSGCVALYKSLPGRRSICVGLLGPGDVFLQENPRHGLLVSGVSAEVLVDATIAMFDLEALPRLMSAAPEIATAVLSGFSQRLTSVQGLVELLLSRDITLRLGSVLLVLANRFGEQGQDGFSDITIPMPHKLLARLIGANRVTVTRVVTEFRTAGLADSHGRNQISVHPERMLAYVQEASNRAPLEAREA
jgi:CRP/FNR family transcriptional regulator